ncbi:ExbD/TolR family protein [Scleromatobacter humisilvae]|jgi:biopolymer transport protein TolR|uniref:Biopolymer transporter ExbD n=1 Tax=Scleromatobacter humisilvae TaxID=2897159 RepID=A0A9X2C3J5_9BURK|nr:biopolymer transporter ExbD [Scleromatobacter humisilvae]MCK9687635.1 biopolymer transporter ExbD [Scleromatobacter humisilvae]
MKLTPIQKRAARNARHGNSLDMNLVSLIDVFTILIFFLLSNSGVETLPAASVHLPESSAKKDPKQTLVVVINATEITVEGRKVADVPPLVNAKDDLIPGLKSELDLVSARPVALAEDAAQAHSVTIMGDKDIPYQLLRKVMYTAAIANFTNVSFAVNQKG